VSPGRERRLHAGLLWKIKSCCYAVEPGPSEMGVSGGKSTGGEKGRGKITYGHHVTKTTNAVSRRGGLLTSKKRGPGIRKGAGESRRRKDNEEGRSDIRKKGETAVKMNF